MNPISLFFKGAAMGAANLIPGVSGGTIAFVTGIYETFIASLKSFDHHALGHLLKFRFKEFAEHVNLRFLAPVLIGAAVIILALAWFLEWLFENYETLTWAFFFGLIVASVLVVGKSIRKWSPGVIAALVVGTAFAVAIALATPAQENDSFLYLVLCGAVAFSSMIIPGLSGSFVLLLMGNYRLVLRGISEFTSTLKAFDISGLWTVFSGIILPIGIGVAIGFVAFSHLLHWLFKRWHDQTVSLLTGFILGSLLIIWPWKNSIKEEVAGEERTIDYEWLPVPFGETSTYIAFGLILVGFLCVWFLEKAGSGRSEPEFNTPEDGESESTPSP